LDQRPPGWKDEGEDDEDGNGVKGEGWKNGVNPFQLDYHGPPYGKFDFCDVNGVGMRKELATNEVTQVVFVD
jgi:hypothetical protein